jgi:hypothetical protein
MIRASGKTLKKPLVRLPFGIHRSEVFVAVLAIVEESLLPEARSDYVLGSAAADD